MRALGARASLGNRRWRQARARRLRARKGEGSRNHLHRRARCRWDETLRLGAVGRPRGAAHDARAAQPARRLLVKRRHQGEWRAGLAARRAPATAARTASARPLGRGKGGGGGGGGGACLFWGTKRRGRSSAWRGTRRWTSLPPSPEARGGGGGGGGLPARVRSSAPRPLPPTPPRPPPPTPPLAPRPSACLGAGDRGDQPRRHPRSGAPPVRPDRPQDRVPAAERGCACTDHADPLAEDERQPGHQL